MRKLALAAAILLAACGSKPDQEIASGTITDPKTGEKTDYKMTTRGDGDDSSVNIKTDEGEVSFGGGPANTTLPDGFTPYPGSTMKTGFSGSSKDGFGGMVSFEAKGQAADVIAHFRKQAEAKGLKIINEVRSGDMVMFGAQDPNNKGTHVQVTATQSGDGVTGSFLHGIAG